MSAEKIICVTTTVTEIYELWWNELQLFYMSNTIFVTLYSLQSFCPSISRYTCVQCTFLSVKTVKKMSKKNCLSFSEQNISIYSAWKLRS